MDNQRLFLYIALFLVLYLLWTSWQQENSEPQIEQAITQQEPPDENTVDGDVPIPSEVSPIDKLPSTQAISNVAKTEYVRVITDVLDLRISTRGADIHHAKLLDYPIRVDEPGNPLVLFNDTGRTYISQSGLIHDPVANQSTAKFAPNHHDLFQSEQSEYRLKDGQDELVVPFTWRGENGLLVNKTLRFNRNSYLVHIDYTLDNQGLQDWIGRQYRQLRHAYVSGDRSWLRLPTYTGAAYYDDKKYEKISFDDMIDDPLNKQIAGGWVAMLQHYFFSAWLAKDSEINDYYTNIVEKAVGNDYIIGMRSEAISVPAGSQAQFQNRLYLGPKLQKSIEKINPGLELTTDYGMFTPLAKPLFWLLDLIYQWVHNWGWAIIILTLLIKLAFYRLSASSYKSMARMRKVQPKMVALRERYSDDKQKLNQAMWDLYKKEKINPIGGCLPILIQMPVFLSLYWVLIESVEMRQAPFMLWIQDLSTKDPLFILPLLMGISMFVQFKLNPRPPDPMQEKVFMILPFFMTAFMAFFPAGLVLYWFVNNLLSIAQQWYITKRYADD